MIGIQIDVSLVVLERFGYPKLEITIIIVRESHDFLTISTNASYHMRHTICTKIVRELRFPTLG